jgi:hypothetical protein
MDGLVDRVIGDENLARAYRCAKDTLVRRRFLELLIWASIALFVSSPAIIRLVSNLAAGVPFLQSLRLMVKYNAVVVNVSILIALIPILSQMVFGGFPIMSLQQRLFASKPLRQAYESVGEGRVAAGPTALNEPSAIAELVETGISIEAAKSLDPRDLLALYAENTSNVTKRIYTRAGVFLLVAVTISIVGIAYFYHGIRDLPQATDYMDHVFGLLPSLSVLIFIELIALLFLRQHRAAMEDFRYFDAVRREREDKLVILKMFAENSSKVSAADVLDAMDIYVQAGRQSRNSPRSRRMRRDQASPFETVTDAMDSTEGLNKFKEHKL